LDFESRVLNLNQILHHGSFQKWKAMIFERIRYSFGFELESNSDFDESERFLLTLVNLKQYICTKINAWRHECNKHLYRA
jgi:hypothetical protein